jgi:lipoprotein-anchoring transpeptidase ErfK/SrfK
MLEGADFPTGINLYGSLSACSRKAELPLSHVILVPVRRLITMSKVQILFGCAAIALLSAAPVSAQTLGRQTQAAVGGSLDRQVSARDIMRAANGIGGGFIETLMTDEGLARATVAYRRNVLTPLPPLPDNGTVYAPAQPVAPLPDQSGPTGSLGRTPVAIDGLDPVYQMQVVDYDGPHRPGTIVIDTNSKFLFLVQNDGTALRYGIGVGRPGFEWAGAKTITRKAEWPSWHPPAEMRKRRPDLPTFMEGGPNNPLGARALYLGSSLYRIHGTNEPSTIGHAVSSGCIRMTNDDVQDLYERVKVGTRVIVM